MERKLNFELVPDSCWYSNLRSILSQKQWDYIKKYVKEKANGKCMICGKNTDKLEAHEKWSYDEKNHIQKLEDIVAICKDCHSVIHIGYTSLNGNIERAEQHYMKVNNVSYAEYRKDLGIANEVHKRRNQVLEWNLDISWLKTLIDEK